MRKTPQFVHLRRKLHSKFLPKIHLSTAYQEAGSDIVVVPDEDRGEFNLKDSHKKVYETASVQVNQRQQKHKNRLTVLFNLAVPKILLQ